MASLTKTITETVGDIQKTTSLYFASFEDFMEYERVFDKEGQQDSTALKELVVGEEYRVVKDISDHGHAIGDIVTVTEYDDADARLPYRVEDALGNGSWVKPEEVEEI